jgi:hypothetical protein
MEMVRVLQLGWFKNLILVTTVIGVTFVGALIFNEGAKVSASQQGTMVSFVLPDEAYTGEFIPIKLVVNNAQNLAGFQSTIVFDTNQLQLADVVVESGLKSSGRDLLQMGPVRRDGSVVIGAVTCPSGHCGDSYGKQSQPLKGVEGQAALATLQLYTEIPGSYELKLENVKLVDPQGNSLAVGSANIVLQVRSK